MFAIKILILVLDTNSLNGAVNLLPTFEPITGV